VPEPAIQVLDGSTFVVGDRRGDVLRQTGQPHGFFSSDTRFISRWELLMDGVRGELLSVNQSEDLAARFFLAAPTATPHDESSYSVIRERVLDQVWFERLTVINNRNEPISLHLQLLIDADFADIFELKDGGPRTRAITRRHDDAEMTLSYARERFARTVTISASRPARIDPASFGFELALEPREQWAVDFTVTPTAEQPGARFSRRLARGNLDDARSRVRTKLARWLAAAPALDSDCSTLRHLYSSSLTDLAALRLFPETIGEGSLPAAGLPWFMTLFGRDSLITSYQTLPYLPELAATTLRVLADRQGRGDDAFRDEEPGKIMHEIRFGEQTAFGERPHSPYFGSADATPLFVVLLDEYHRWSGDDALIRQLEPHARAAIRWIDEFGDGDGDGYVEYERRNVTSGLANQSWRDSWNSMQFHDGSLAATPIAPCEVQGYVYDAKRRAARLARAVWRDEAWAGVLEGEAEQLRARFHRDFWLPQRGHYALALDRDKRPLDSLTSTIGHLLWSGILDQEHAEATARSLLGDELFTGWGVRTMGTSDAGYSPLSYHNGTVWPHDNSLIAAGLARYGFREQSNRLTCGLLAAAPHFEHRLPEVFAGYAAELTGVPVLFPTASRPQAWSAGAPLLLITTMLGLRPTADGRRADPLLPAEIGFIELRDAGERGATIDSRTVGASVVVEPIGERPVAELLDLRRATTSR
jgi:glycogen debranching enzyme